MISGWTFGRRLAAGFGLACLVLLLIAVVSDRNTANLIDTEDWVNHTYQVRTRLADLSASLVAAESAQRGFLISGNDGNLEPYRTSLGTIKEAMDELESDEVIKGALGKHVVEKMREAQTEQWDSFRLQVTGWELERYFPVL